MYSTESILPGPEHNLLKKYFFEQIVLRSRHNWYRICLYWLPRDQCSSNNYVGVIHMQSEESNPIAGLIWLAILRHP